MSTTKLETPAEKEIPVPEDWAEGFDERIAGTLRALDVLAATQTYDLFRTSGGATLAPGVRAILQLLMASRGECRRALPYARLRPVLEADGSLHWCCGHDPEHRA